MLLTILILTSVVSTLMLACGLYELNIDDILPKHVRYTFNTILIALWALLNVLLMLAT